MTQKTEPTLAARVAALERRAGLAPAYYSLPEVATLSGVSRRTVFNWVYKMGLPVAVLDGTQRVKREDFDAFMAKHTH